MKIDKNEAKRLLASISQEELHEAMQNPLTHCAPGQEDNFQTATSYVAGKIMARLEALQNDNKAELPTVEEINTVLDTAGHTGANANEVIIDDRNVLFDLILELCQRSYRYGYYQGRNDFQDYAPDCAIVEN